LDAYQSYVLAGGHTHRQQLRRLGKTLFVNPGSAGLASKLYLPDEQGHFDPWADYAILTSDGPLLSIEFRQVPFDVQALLNALSTSDMPGVKDLLAGFQEQTSRQR
jgi:hypothetical protein